ncbi:MAG: tyrosine-type recombinase/integrase [bacterium]
MNNFPKKFQKVINTIETPQDRLDNLVEVFGGRESLFTKAMIDFLFAMPSDWTVDNYGRVYAHFFDWEPTHPSKIRRSHGREYKQYQLDEVGNCAGTVKGKIHALRSLFDEFVETRGPDGSGLLEINPFRRVRLKDLKEDQFARSRPVDDADLIRMRMVPDRSTEKGIRDRFLLDFVVLTGRRRSEFSTLQVKDLDVKTDGTIVYRYVPKYSRTEKERYLAPPLKEQLVEYLKIPGRFPGETLEESLECLPDEEGLFISCSRNRHTLREKHGRDFNKHLHPQTVLGIIKRLAKEADGVDPDDVTVHGLRHLHARLADRSTGDREGISEQLDHSDPDTTRIYLDKLDEPVNEFWEDIEEELDETQEDSPDDPS